MKNSRSLSPIPPCVHARYPESVSTVYCHLYLFHISPCSSSNPALSFAILPPSRPYLLNIFCHSCWNTYHCAVSPVHSIPRANGALRADPSSCYPRTLVHLHDICSRSLRPHTLQSVRTTRASASRGLRVGTSGTKPTWTLADSSKGQLDVESRGSRHRMRMTHSH